MTTNRETNPPTRRDEDFPKTSTFPEGWVMDALMEKYNPMDGVTEPEADSMPVPTTGFFTRANGKNVVRLETQSAETAESPFTRQLNPFPNSWELTGMYL